MIFDEFRIVHATRSLMKSSLFKRVKCTILYATETGRSEKFAILLGDLFNKAFNVKVKNFFEKNIIK